MVKEMGDLSNLDPNRYMKLNVYTRSSGKIVFKDYEILLDNYESKVCLKVIKYKFDKIFYLRKDLAKGHGSKNDSTTINDSQLKDGKHRSKSANKPAAEDEKAASKNKIMSKMKSFMSKNIKKDHEKEHHEEPEVDKKSKLTVKDARMSESEMKAIEIKLIMRLPEVKNELIRKANPMNFDLYRCAMSVNGELESYAEHIHSKLLNLHKNQQMEK